MSGAGDKGFVKEIEKKADNAKSGLKKTTTNEKKWTPTASDIKEDKTAK